MEWKQTEFVHRCSASTAWDQELFYSNMYPPNISVEWIDTDTPKNAINDNKIIYKFNEYGFRSDPFYQSLDINILVNGCSLTVGVGVNENWTEKLRNKIQNHTKKTVSVYNLATSGASCDYVTRSTYKVSTNLAIDYVFVYWPSIYRLEQPDPNNHKRIWQSLAGHYSFPKELANDYFLEGCKIKNKLLLQSFSRKRFFDNQEDIHFDNYARDGQHPDEEWHERVAQMFFEQFMAKY